LVTLNVGNMPTTLYNAMLELRGKLHARTWVQVFEYLMQDPEGLIDMEFLSIDGHPVFDDRGRLQASHKIVFRAGRFIHEFDPTRPEKERFKELSTIADSKKVLGLNHGKNH
jgi:hypothetical protein